MSAIEPSTVELAIRPPVQRRTREAWVRVLDAGVQLLEEQGHEAFTIAAVCARAGVPPRAIYARAPSKDALYLAVYERGMERIAADHAVFVDVERWRSCSTEELVRTAVNELAGLFFKHAPLLRSVVRTSGVHPEVLRRGRSYVNELGQLFVDMLLGRQDEIEGRGAPVATLWLCFNVLFAALDMRITNGSDFAEIECDDAVFVDRLADLACSYLVRRGR